MTQVLSKPLKRMVYDLITGHRKKGDQQILEMTRMQKERSVRLAASTPTLRSLSITLVLTAAPNALSTQLLALSFSPPFVLSLPPTRCLPRPHTHRSETARENMEKTVALKREV